MAARDLGAATATKNEIRRTWSSESSRWRVSGFIVGCTMSSSADKLNSQTLPLNVGGNNYEVGTTSTSSVTLSFPDVVRISSMIRTMACRLTDDVEVVPTAPFSRRGHRAAIGGYAGIV